MSKEQSGGSCQKKSSAHRLAGNFPIPPLPLVHTTHTCILRCRKTHVSRPEPARAEPSARPRLRCAATAEGARRLAASRPAGPRHLEEDHPAPAWTKTREIFGPGRRPARRRPGQPTHPHSSAHPTQVRQTRAGAPPTRPAGRGTFARGQGTAGPRPPPISARVESSSGRRGETRACVRVTELSSASSSSSLLSAESRLLPRREGRERKGKTVRELGTG